MVFETNNGDNVQFQKKRGQYEYRAVLNEKRALAIDLKNERLSFVRFLETTSYYFLYGSYYVDYENDGKTTIPYIVRIEKNFSNVLYYFDKSDDIYGMAHMSNLFEFGADNLVALEFVSGTYTFPEYYGLYRLVQYDQDFNILSYIDCGEHEAYPTIAYDRIDYMNGDGTHIYFDKEFNRVSKYSSISVVGYFELMEECLVNGERYSIGSVFSEPGNYELDDEEHEPITVTVLAEISLTGELNGKAYKNYVEYKVSGGDVMINDEPVYLNGTVSRPGKYLIKVSGLNGYTLEKEFLITPELYTSISDGGSLSIGDTIQFAGKASLNGTTISSGYVLREPGSYILELKADDEVIEEIRFTVPDVLVTNDSKIKIYIGMGSLIIILSAILAVLIIVGNKKKKRR